MPTPDFEEQFHETAQVLSDAIRRRMLAQIEDFVWQEPSGILAAIDTSNVAETTDDELTYENLRDAIQQLREQMPRPSFYSLDELAERHRRHFGEAWASAMREAHNMVPDEITDDDRERWARELETTPMPDVGQDAGGALSSDELLEAIGEAVDEWKDVRDGE